MTGCQEWAVERIATESPTRDTFVRRLWPSDSPDPIRSVPDRELPISSPALHASPVSAWPPSLSSVLAFLLVVACISQRANCLPPPLQIGVFVVRRRAREGEPEPFLSGPRHDRRGFFGLVSCTPVALGPARTTSCWYRSRLAGAVRCAASLCFASAFSSFSLRSPSLARIIPLPCLSPASKLREGFLPRRASQHCSIAAPRPACRRSTRNVVGA